MACILILHEKIGRGFVALFQIPTPSFVTPGMTTAEARDNVRDNVQKYLGRLGDELVYEVRIGRNTLGEDTINIILRNAAFGSGEFMDSSLIASHPKVERLVEDVYAWTRSWSDDDEMRPLPCMRGSQGEGKEQPPRGHL